MKIVSFVLSMGVFMASASWLMAGTVTGTVKYEGQVPQFKPLNMTADPVCASHHSGPIYPDTLVLGDGNTMANILVKVTNPPAGNYPVPAEPVVLDQKGCMYDPHVVAVRVGQAVKFLNPDGTLHNVHSMPKVNSEFNMAMPQFRKTAMKTFDKKEETPFATKCDVHPWMNCWMAVFDHPFFAVTGKDGKFTIDGLKAGTYTIEAWHERLGVQTGTVTVTDSGSATIDFTFKK